MKIATSLIATVVAMTPMAASASRPLSRNGLRRVLSSARRLDQGQIDIENYIEDYSIQFLQCIADERIQDADEDGGNNDDGQYGVVFFRLCPSNSCSDGGKCSGGHADFAISVASYVETYLEDQADNMQWDDQMDMDNFSGCNQYQMENGNGNSYYVGPTCSDDGLNIKLGLFEDYQCQYQSETSFESISNGMSLPFSDGGLVSSSCVACAEYDNGNYEVKDICVDLYDNAPLKCESWDIMHYYWDSITEVMRYGQDTTGCFKMKFLAREPSVPVSEIGSIIAIFLLVAVSLGGGYYYTVWWNKKKETLERIDSDEEDEGDEYHQHEDDDAGEDRPQEETPQPQGSFA